MKSKAIRAGLIGLASLGLASCGSEEQTETTETTETEVADPAAEAAAEAMAKAEALKEIYMAAAANPARPESDTARDEGRKPVDVLAFYGVEPGMTVVDLHSGGGYFARLASTVVGPGGSVIAHNGAGVAEADRPDREAAFSDFGNIAFAYADPAELDMADGSVDVVILGLLYHHWHYSEASGEELSPTGAARIANVYRMLKPGGTFAVIEHLAPEDATRAAVNATHRVSAPIVEADITAAGFVLEAASDMHTYPEDDMTQWWRELTPRGKTNRLVHLYRKPME